MAARLCARRIVLVLLLTGCRNGGDDPVPTLQSGPPALAGRVALTLFDQQSQPHIWLCDADGGDLAELDPTGRSSQPRFSRDGRQLAFVGDSGLCIQDLVTNTRRVLGAGGGSPSFSPDGQRLAWLDQPTRIRIEDLTTGEHSTVAIAGPGILEAVEWSPVTDQLLLALVGTNRGPFGLGLAIGRLDGSPAREFGSWFGDARWSPDGRMVGSADGIVDTRGRSAANAPANVAPLAWSGDGKGYVCVIGGRAGLHHAICDFAGNVLVDLPLPDGFSVPRLIDYGYLWADWSWD